MSESNRFSLYGRSAAFPPAVEFHVESHQPHDSESQKAFISFFLYIFIQDVSKSSIATQGTSQHTGSLSHIAVKTAKAVAAKRRKCRLVLRDRGVMPTLLRLCAVADRWSRLAAAGHTASSKKIKRQGLNALLCSRRDCALK